MQNSAIIEEPELRRFARLAAPFLQGVAVGRQDPRAARDRPGSGLEFLDLRDYQAGDDIRHIDWRQTARRQHAVVRRFRDETAADWTICIDCSASVGLRIRKWSMMVRLASALAYACLFSGHRVALLLFSDRINDRCELGRGARQFSTLLNLLLAQDVDAMVKPAATRLFAHARSERKTKPINQSNLALCRDYLSAKSNAFVISDFLQPDGMRSQLESIRSTAASTDALQVLADDEVYVPAIGVTRLEDVESGHGHQIEMSDQTMNDADRALIAHGVRLRRNCAGLGIRFSSCQSEEKWQQVLLKHLRFRS